MELFLHIGYPKTATTWWQQDIFAHQPEIGLVPKYEQYTIWGKHLITAHDFDFNPKLVRTGLLEVATRLQREKIVISWEHLLGDSAFGSDHLVRHMTRLHHCFPEARIIIFLREQLSMIESIYKQYVQEGGTWSLRDFLQADYPYRNFFSPAYLNYYQTIRHYEAKFGSDNIYIGLFEAVKQNPKQVIDGLFTWMNISSDLTQSVEKNSEKNKSLSDASIQLLRRINYFLPSRFSGRGPVPYIKTPFLKAVTRVGLQNYLDPYFIRPLTQKLSKGLKIPLHLQQDLQTYYQASNQKVLEDYGLPIDEFNYSLPQNVETK